jgi:O-antigen/teichoic acid export membrane protein
MTGYIFNYRQLLVSANQRQYLVHSYFQTISLLQSLTQIVLALLFRNLYVWVVVGLVYTVIGCILFNRRINREYPWLKIDLKAGRQNLKRYPEVLKKTRQIFVQRINDFVLNRCDAIFVGWFVSVTQVAFYGNYTMIIYKLIFLVNILSDGLRAGVGNLLAEGNEQNTMKVFWELVAVRFFIMGGVIFSLLLGIQGFITCWLGAQYQLSTLIVYLLVLHLFFYLQDAAVLIFINGAGLYQDVWATWTSFIITISVTLLLGPHLGIAGILIGKISSLLVINVFWKPYFLFSQGFHKSVWVFWRGMMPFYLIFALFTAATVMAKTWLMDVYADSFLTLIAYGIMAIVPIMTLYFFALFICTRGMKYFVARKPAVYRILSKYTF